MKQVPPALDGPLVLTIIESQFCTLYFNNSLYKKFIDLFLFERVRLMLYWLFQIASGMGLKISDFETLKA